MRIYPPLSCRWFGGFVGLNLCLFPDIADVHFSDIKYPENMSFPQKTTSLKLLLVLPQNPDVILNVSQEVSGKHRCLLNEEQVKETH